MGWGVVQVVECLPNKGDIPSSIPSTKPSLHSIKKFSPKPEFQDDPQDFLVLSFAF
jgi:hypothetical protein